MKVEEVDNPHLGQSGLERTGEQQLRYSMPTCGVPVAIETSLFANNLTAVSIVNGGFGNTRAAIRRTRQSGRRPARRVGRPGLTHPRG